jgi:hypothetical protein
MLPWYDISSVTCLSDSVGTMSLTEEFSIGDTGIQNVELSILWTLHMDVGMLCCNIWNVVEEAESLDLDFRIKSKTEYVSILS